MIINAPKSVKVETFESVMFRCVAEGYGLITVTWKKVGSVLPLTATINNSGSVGKVTSVLTITRAAGFYSGQYYCIARNKAGPVRSHYANLYVQGM